MSYGEPARTAACRSPSTAFAALVVVSAALIGVLGYQRLAVSSSSATSTDAARPVPYRADESLHGDPPGDPPGDQAGDQAGDQDGALGEADGVVPDGVTVFDDNYAAVARLDPDLLRALRQAAADAAGRGVELYVDSGWRSPQYQQQLLEQAISEYGSRQAAARWVATPDTSAHVSGDAVDLGPSDATAWLSKHGASYGLCQTYRNEPWHYELRPDAVDHGCPPKYADPTQDPRMHQ